MGLVLIEAACSTSCLPRCYLTALLQVPRWAEAPRRHRLQSPSRGACLSPAAVVHEEGGLDVHEMFLSLIFVVDPEAVRGHKAGLEAGHRLFQRGTSLCASRSIL